MSSITTFLEVHPIPLQHADLLVVVEGDADEEEEMFPNLYINSKRGARLTSSQWPGGAAAAAAPPPTARGPPLHCGKLHLPSRTAIRICRRRKTFLCINENVTNHKQEVDEILVVNRAVAAVAVPAPVVAYVVHGSLGGEERLRLGGRVARQRDQRHHGEAGGGLLHDVAVLDRLELS